MSGQLADADNDVSADLVGLYDRERRPAGGSAPTQATATSALGAHLATTFRHSHGRSRRR